jgi:hypothetical protein
MATVDVLRQRAEEIIHRTVDAIFTEIASYRAVRDPALRSDVRDLVAEHHQTLLDCVARERPVNRDELPFLHPHVVRQVGMIPVADHLRAGRVYLCVATDTLLEDASGRPSVEASVAAVVSLLIDYVDRSSTFAAELYSEIERLQPVSGEVVRRELLDDLIAARPVMPGPRQEAARGAGLGPGRPCFVVAAVPRSELSGERSLPAVGAALARACQNHRTPLTVVRCDHVVLVVSAVEREIGPVVDRLGETYARLAQEGTRLAIGVSTVHPTLGGVASAYDEAFGTAQSLGADGGVFALPTLSAFEYLTSFRDGTAERLISAAVQRFVDADLQSGGVLAATLLTYVACSLSVKTVSERLAVHVNTAHYRLNKIAEQTGRDLRRLDDVLELVIAIRLARSRGDRPLGVWR